jgi:enolase-phosphatase E1
VTIPLGRRGVEVLLLDIEGTTTPLAFVHDVLFPYARRRLHGYVKARRDGPEVADIAAALAAEHAAERDAADRPPAWRTSTVDALTESLTQYAEWLMDRDRKSPGLKRLQGVIWDEGYQRGELRGVVFDDVPRAVRRWRASGLRIAIYSSGSELAQRRLFESAGPGDLSSSIERFFDTGVGAKIEADSYRRIASALGVPGKAVLFVSDVTAELAAARAAGLQVALMVRPDNRPQPDAEAFEQIRSCDDIA